MSENNWLQEKVDDLKANAFSDYVLRNYTRDIDGYYRSTVNPTIRKTLYQLSREYDEIIED